MSLPTPRSLPVYEPSTITLGDFELKAFYQPGYNKLVDLEALHILLGDAATDNVPFVQEIQVKKIYVQQGKQFIQRAGIDKPAFLKLIWIGAIKKHNTTAIDILAAIMEQGLKFI